MKKGVVFAMMPQGEPELQTTVFTATAVIAAHSVRIVGKHTMR